jgi:hypothetical protein
MPPAYAAVLTRHHGGAATLPPGRPNAAQADRCAEDGSLIATEGDADDGSRQAADPDRA